MQNPTFKESYKALMYVCSFQVYMILISLTIIIIRATYVQFTIKNSSFFEVTGLGTYWFVPWLLAILSALVIVSESNRIVKREKYLVKKRMMKISNETFK